MKRFVLLSALAALVLASIGCGDGMAITRRERQERHRLILENDMKQINDDWDSIWLMDRPTRLSYSRTE
jgi:hypothetical protein